MIQDSGRKPSDSLQKLSECLCDEEKMPLLCDSSFENVSLCYRALPNYEAFVQKREGRVERRLEEGRVAEQRKQKQLKDQIDCEIPKKYRKFLRDDNQPIPIKNEHEFAHLYLEEVYSNLSC